MEIGNNRIDQTLQAALSGLAARQRVISDNVANVDTPGFKSSSVQFEQALKAALGQEGERPRVLMLTSVGNSVPQPDDASFATTPKLTTSMATSQRADGNNVDIDQEMIQLAETNLTYNALAQVTNSRIQLLRTVVNDGRR